MPRAPSLATALAVATLLVQPARADDLAPATETVAAGSIALTVEAASVVEPSARAEVRSAASGTVEKCLVDVGATVKTGDLLAQLDAREAGAALEAAKARFTRGQEDLDRARQAEYTAEARARRGGKDAEGAEAARAAAQAEQKRLKTEIIAAATELDRLQTQAGETRIVSPLDGVVVARGVSPGEVVRAEGPAGATPTPPLFTIASLARVVVRATLAEAEGARVQPGQRIAITVTAQAERAFAGVVASVLRVETVRDGAVRFEVKIDLDNAEGLLKPGMAVRARLAVGERACAVVVPRDAITRDGERATVDVVVDAPGGAPRVERRSVRLGASDDARCEILEGVRAGERIAVHRPHR